MLISGITFNKQVVEDWYSGINQQNNKIHPNLSLFYISFSYVLYANVWSSFGGLWNLLINTLWLKCLLTTYALADTLPATLHFWNNQLRYSVNILLHLCTYIKACTKETNRITSHILNTSVYINHDKQFTLQTILANVSNNTRICTL